MFRRVLMLVFAVAVLSLPSVAHADDGWYWGPRVSFDTWRLTRTTFQGGTYTIDGGTRATAFGGSFDVGGGFRYRFVYSEIGFQVGAGGGAIGAAVPASDITLASTGALSVVSPHFETGVFAHPTRRLTLRGGAFVAVELLSLSMERPGSPGTHAYDAFADRAVAGPTAGVLWSIDRLTLGLVARADALHLGSVSSGLLISNDW